MPLPIRLPAAILGALLLGACATPPAPRAATDAPPPHLEPAPAAHDWAVRGALRRVGPDATEALSHVVFLTNAFLEGRSPDGAGDELAAAYIERRFRELGLAPAFGPEPGSRVAYTQPFGVRGGLEIERASLAITSAGGERASLALGADFVPAGFSPTAAGRGPGVFVGYAIERGEDGYRGFAPGERLDGAVAVALRFEPIDETGRSAWTDDGSWSRRASLEAKVRAVAERGAAGLVVVNTPGADDPRVGMLPDHRATDMAIDAPFPVVFVSPPAAERLLAAMGEGATSLGALRREADAGGVVRPLGVELSLDVALDREDVDTANVGAVLPGRGGLADELVVIAAHYDHIGRGYYHARDPENLGRVRPGADDNASGVAGLLLLARRLAERYGGLPAGAEARSILFLAFGAEELGLLGAAHFLEATDLRADDLAAMLNLDMIGRLRPDDGLWALGVGTAAELEPLVRRHAGDLGQPLTLRASGAGASDHAVFYHSGVPALHLFTGPHDDYHTVRDTFDTLNYAGLVRVVDLVERVAMDLATAPTAPEFVVPRRGPGP